jgi:hypothetical protein
MTIRNRRRNRWRRKLRRCNQCKHWAVSSAMTSHCKIDWYQFSLPTLKLFKERYALDGYGSAWWGCAIACPHYQAYDRTANQLAQSTQRISILDVKSCLN